MRRARLELVGSPVRPAEAGDHDAVRRIFMATVALGRPVTVDGLDAYADFSLRWYHQHEAGSVLVHERDGVVDGYVLVGTDEDAHDRQQRWAAVRYLARLVALGLRGRLRGDALRFHRLRIRDGWALYHAGPVQPAPAHIHLNLLPGARAMAAGRELIAAADKVVAAAGHDAWYAQINTPAGRRARALERLGAQVIDVSPNHTLSHFADTPVERLTIFRRLPHVDADVANALP